MIPDGTVLAINSVVSAPSGDPLPVQVIYVDGDDIMLVGIKSNGKPFHIRMAGHAEVVAADFARRRELEAKKR